MRNYLSFLSSFPQRRYYFSSSLNFSVIHQIHSLGKHDGQLSSQSYAIHFATKLKEKSLLKSLRSELVSGNYKTLDSFSLLGGIIIFFLLFSALLLDDRQEIFNPNCRSCLLLSNIKERCDCDEDGKYKSFLCNHSNGGCK